MSEPPFKVSSLKDLKDIDKKVGVPVGPRTGPNKRTQEKKEWHVLRRAICGRLLKLPIEIRRGLPPEEPDFVVTRGTTAIWIEITEATNEKDQKEMTDFELSEPAVLIGKYGGRYQDIASRPGLGWAADIVDAIKRKSGKAIFTSSATTTRHLIIYPNSNAARLLSERAEREEAIPNLREAINNEAASLIRTTNGCRVHVLGEFDIYFDIVPPP